jgi:hypothetical protein
MEVGRTFLRLALVTESTPQFLQEDTLSYI